MMRCEEQMMEWTRHWQCDTEVQDMEDKPWMNEECGGFMEGPPRLKEHFWEKSAMSYRSGCWRGL